MGVLLKFVMHLLVNIMWKKVGGSGAIPPVRLPKGKKPIDIPVVSPWQTFVVMWTARKVWAAYGGQVKDKMAASPNGAVQQVGDWLPNAPAKKASATKPAAPKPTPAAPSPRKPTLWKGSAQPAPTPAPPAAPATPAAPAPAAPSPPRAAPHYATRKFDTTDAAPPADAPPPAPQQAPAAPPSPAPPARPGSLLSSLRKRK